MAKKTKEKKRERSERRFLPQSTTSPLLVQVTGGLGAAALGAGLWGQYGTSSPIPYAVWIVAAGALLAATAVWIGTSADPAVRVGDAGLALEKGGLRRVPWWGVESITWDEATSALVVQGKEEAGDELVARLGARSQPQAVAWLLKEARARVPQVVNVGDQVLESLQRASREAGVVIALDPIQVVGKHCAESDKAIAYEPDARVCPKCERVYHKAHVPESCRCGASLEVLKKKPAEVTA